MMTLPQRLVLLACFLTLLLTACRKPAIEPAMLCNGAAHHCEMRYSDMTFVTTHNAFNYAEGPLNYTGPNQDYPIDRQLADGVKAFMIDVYYQPGPDSLIAPAVVYHSFPLFGFEPLPDVLNLIKDFLVDNPNEVLSIIFESHVHFDKIQESLELAGLMSYLYSHPDGEQWPFLEEMILSGKRLVIFSERSDPDPPGWYHYIWDESTETDFDIDDRTEFDCSFNRGDPSNELFILNHFITSSTSGVGLVDSATLINAFDYLYPRAKQCEDATGKTANFLSIDFYAQGEVFRVADSLNRP